MLELYIVQVFILLLCIIGLLLVNKHSKFSYNKTTNKILLGVFFIGIIPFIGIAPIFVSVINIIGAILSSFPNFAEWLDAYPFDKDK